MCRRTLVFLAAAFAVASLQPASASAAIQPGAQTFTKGAQCTANFVFTNVGGTYLGQAAHCSSTGGATETDGCTSGSLPIGTPVEISGASRPGTLAYNSWIAMQAANEADPDACAYNDFALVKLHPDDVGNVNPSVPGFRGPTGLGGPSATGATVFSWGNSSLRAGITKLSPKQGVVVSTEGDGWSRSVYTATPGIPGDSGSGFLNADGEAIGVLSTVAILPLPLSNGVGDLGKELAYAQAKGFTVSLLPGTKPFRADLVGAILGS
ncbi:MAG: trypsin-like peptidase domain-containing protein [Thermoleophilaceae bacterium]|nr:trypsin-like peptidase domain-containing protein [Thermoleophilaceae bacterium]